MSKETRLKKVADTNLREFKEWADHLKVPFFLMDGTLLGVYRDGEYCPGDYRDIDVGVLSENYHLVKKLVGELVNHGFKFKNFPFNNRIESYTLFRDGCRVDIARINKRGKERYNIFRGKRLGIVMAKQGKAREMLAYVYTAHCFEKFEQLEFKGMKLKIPSNVEDYLSVRYVDWRVPVRHKDYDLTDPKQCPCLRNDYV